MKRLNPLFFLVSAGFAMNVHAQVDVKLPDRAELQQIMQSNQAIPMPMLGKGDTFAPALDKIDAAKSKPTQSSAKGKDLLVFVSASMPPDTIKSYSRQANEYGAVLVLRGFVKDKLSETRKLIQALNEGGAEWMIQPNAYKLFKVDRVPSIVLSLPTSGSVTDEGCAPESEYVKITGDVGIGPALATFAAKSPPDLSKAASQSIADFQAKYAQKRLK